MKPATILQLPEQEFGGDIIKCSRNVLHDYGINNSGTFVLCYLLTTEMLGFNS
jgi:hypothetical protein